MGCELTGETPQHSSWSPTSGVHGRRNFRQISSAMQCVAILDANTSNLSECTENHKQRRLRLCLRHGAFLPL